MKVKAEGFCTEWDRLVQKECPEGRYYTSGMPINFLPWMMVEDQCYLSVHVDAVWDVTKSLFTPFRVVWIPGPALLLP
ncbi:hypothetical protein ABIF68_003974 [Bradyrhizobium japonicum]|nr:hypothetical protein [Bradyrhizobium japonicum]